MIIIITFTTTRAAPQPWLMLCTRHISPTCMLSLWM